MSLKSPAQVRDIAAAVTTLTESDFAKRYFGIDEDDYGVSLSDEDLDYTWTNFQDVCNLYLRAADAGRYVLFTADQ